MKPRGHAESQKHERRIAKRFGGQVTPASGAFWSHKGDVRTVSMVMEHKYTGSLERLVVKASWLTKIEKEALQDFKMPVFMFHLAGADYVVLTDNDFYELFDEPSDFLDGEYHFEFMSGNKSLSITKKFLDKVEEREIRKGKEFSLPLHLGGRVYAVVTEDGFEEAIDRWLANVERRS